MRCLLCGAPMDDVPLERKDGEEGLSLLHICKNDYCGRSILRIDGEVVREPGEPLLPDGHLLTGAKEIQVLTYNNLYSWR